MRVHIEITVSHEGETAERTIEYDDSGRCDGFPVAFALDAIDMQVMFGMGAMQFTRRGSRDPE